MTSPASPPPPSSGSSATAVLSPPGPAARPVAPAADPAPLPGSWRRAAAAAIGAFAVSRFVVLLAAWAGLSQLIAADPSRTKGLLAEGALMWDGAWYWRVVTQGYYLGDAQTGSNLAFCPLYPLLIRGLTDGLAALGIHVGDPVYGNFVLAGLLVSNLSFLAALVLLWRLVRRDYSATVADSAVLLLAVFPTALYWSAIYTESLFLLLVVGCFWGLRTQRWALAAACAALAAVTRWPGVLLGPVILVAYFTRPGVAEAAGARVRAIFRPSVLWLGLVPLPFLAYLAYLRTTFGDPFVFMHVEQVGWGHVPNLFFPQTWLDTAGRVINSWRTAAPAADPILHWGGGQRIYAYQDLALTALFAGLAIWAAWRRLLAPAALTWLALGVIFPLWTGTTMGIARYLLPLWPAFVLLAVILERRPGLARGWWVASTGLLALTTYLWASGRWMD